MKMYSMREERDMKPATFSHMLSSLLYEKRFGPYFVEPVVAGLDASGAPYISAMDLIGAPVLTKDFVVAGSSSENLYGMAESLWRPDLAPEDLFETVSQVLLASQDRDAMAGWGAVVHVITAEGVTTRELKARMD
jgi:20S proteasome subunit beta 3